MREGYKTKSTLFFILFFICVNATFILISHYNTEKVDSSEIFAKISKSKKIKNPYFFTEAGLAGLELNSNPNIDEKSLMDHFKGTTIIENIAQEDSPAFRYFDIVDDKMEHSYFKMTPKNSEKVELVLSYVSKASDIYKVNIGAPVKTVITKRKNPKHYQKGESHYLLYKGSHIFYQISNPEIELASYQGDVLEKSESKNWFVIGIGWSKELINEPNFNLE
ncbi:hypothetical protein [Aureibacter tunicatorum]|uniref:Uncharacterized protein n=1 Tax=Aureibacter tunicatorum TaxID=866807 RepID=A0AAE3XM18_9BACT|nr:hypothetical protein [Aureibacter tunicatorum]MDR6239417.1 hypothetical protein [Aureibacter tunicatorum]BDD04660.1 hypothetical protein AUTU_21430 [Aureibacter tunicatorum]